MTTLQRITFDDLMVQPDYGYLHELVRGEILRMPPPKEDHGDVTARMIFANGVLDGDDVLPGFSEELSNIFA